MLTRREMLKALGASGLLLGGAGCSGGGGGGTAFTAVPSRFPDVGQPAVGDALVSGTIGEPATFLGFLTSDSSSHGISGLVTNSLLRYNERLELEGEAAEAFEISRNELDITFRLRRDIRFVDGRPLTARDVKFSFELYLDPENPTPYSDPYTLVKRFDLIDDYTFRVRYETPFARALESWAAISILPRHVLTGLRGPALADSRFAREQPIGSGPYVLRTPEDWVPGQRLTFWRNPDYFEGTVWVERQIIRVIPDTQTQFLELKSGGLDTMGLTPTQFKFQTGTEEFRANFEKFQYYGNGYTYLGFNLRDPRFGDKRVRQAFAYAIDQDEIIRGVLLGYGVPLSAPVSPGHWVYNPNVTRYDYNPGKALELLEQAGFRRDASGRQVKDGKPFRFEIITNQGNQQRLRTGEIIQRRLAEIGVEVRVRPIEWAVFIKDFIQPAKYEATILGWGMPPDPDQYEIWHSSQIDKGLNRQAYRNAEVDRLLVEGRSTFDREKRKTAYWKFQEIMAEEQPYVFLYVPESLAALHRRFKGVVPTENGYTYQSATRWYVPQQYQKWTDLV